MDPEFVEIPAVDRFVVYICDWKILSPVHMHSCENITAVLPYALEDEAAGTASYKPAIVYHLRGQCRKKPKAPSRERTTSRKTIPGATKR